MTLVREPDDTAVGVRAADSEAADELRTRFRASMRMVASTVAVITASHKGQWGGLTATSVCSLSIEPPLVLVCVNRSSRTHGLIARGRHFAINYLADEHHDVARMFASAEGLPEEKFAAGRWVEGPRGMPVLAGCLSMLECTVRRKLDEGTHTVFIGTVNGVEIGHERAPLIYVRSDYARLAART